MTRFPVTFGGTFLDDVRREFPLHPSEYHRVPTAGEFMAGPAKAAVFRFAYEWAALDSDASGLIRAVTVPPTEQFPAAYIFYGFLVAKAGGEAVEIVSFERDDEYWDRAGCDMED